MKLAFISDTHFGDNNCRLIENNKLTETYFNLREFIREENNYEPLDFLVLIGDVLDFSINSFEKSCKIGSIFFKAIARDNLAKQLIYIPGNHDKYIWDAVEWETNIIRRLKEHKEPRKFRRTQPGIISLSEGDIFLPGVRFVEGQHRYGSLFIEGLFEKNKILPVNIVYPNLYIKGSNKLYLVTHGHMLELAWVLISELLSDMPEFSHQLSIRELEEYNIAFTSMICTGVGQSGDVSKLFYKIQVEAKKGESQTLKYLLKYLIPKLENMIELGALEFLDDIALEIFKKQAIHIAEKKVKDSRYDKEFLKRKSVRERFERFFKASLIQCKEFNLNFPEVIIFGHTHEVIPANNPFIYNFEYEGYSKNIHFYNTGGWLKAKGKKAAIFFLDENEKLISYNI